MQPDAAALGDVAELTDGIDHAERKVRRRADDHDRIVVDQRFNRGKVHAQIARDRARDGPRGPSASRPC